ncbi:MAG: geranylgeranyl reductase family protein [Thermoplasmata archaeon]
MSKRDVIVVGAGLAGLTVARYCAEYGLDVLVIEKKKSIGSAVRCGEYLASDDEIMEMFPQCYDLGDLFQCLSGCVRREFENISVYSPKGKRYVVPFQGIMIDREEFEKNLAAQAERNGAELLLDTMAKSVRGEDVITSKGSLSARIIVGADGPLSRVASSVGLPRPPQLYRAVTTYVEGSYRDEIALFFGQLSPGGYAWIFPKVGKANAGLGVWDKYDGSTSDLLKSWLRTMGLRFGAIRRKLLPASGPAHRLQRGNVLIVGDSAGHVIPTTGGGIQTSMICAREAAKSIAECLSSGVLLEAYESACKRIVWGPLRMGLKIKRLADKVLWSDLLTTMAMRFLGIKGIGRAIRCQHLFRS